jgi:NlpC/P60 family putative phage cell wall peptidase
MAHVDDIVQAARGWIGTPYRHQGATRGAGADCLGLVRGVWLQLFGDEPETVPPYSMDWSEPQRDELLWSAARRHLRECPKGPPQCGNVILLRMRDGSVAKHLGIVTCTAPTASFVHAYMRHGVVESPLSAPWRRRIVARFEFPDEVR